MFFRAAATIVGRFVVRHADPLVAGPLEVLARRQAVCRRAENPHRTSVLNPSRTMH